MYRCVSKCTSPAWGALNYLRLNLVNSRTMGTKKLDGKVAIVTASTDGIGLEIARRLGQDGAHVVISSRKQANVDRAVSDLQANNLSVMGLVCHVAKDEHRKQLIEQTINKFGGVDILVSNAAVNPSFGPILDTTKEIWNKIMEVNVTASFLLCKEVVPHMEKRGGGSVMFVTSIGGYVPFEDNAIITTVSDSGAALSLIQEEATQKKLLGPYSVSKTALLGLVKAIAPPCAEKNIRVNGIAPGVIQTKFSEALWKNEAAADQGLKTIPMGRFGKPEDIAGLASFLASEDSAYITGETICATGGMKSRL